MDEVFVAVAGYEGLYEISTLGTLRTLARQGTNTREVIGSVDHGGYRRYALCKNSTTKSISAHRLVAETFIPNPEGKRTVNHKNGNKLDNRVENLEWMTHSENHQHAYNVLGRQAAMLGKTGAAHHNAKAVVRVCKATGECTNYATLQQAADAGDFNIGHISACCNGHRNSHKGYFWRFL